MIPSPWAALILLLATQRIVRLVGWDHLPLLVRARAWVMGEHATNRGTPATRMGLTREQVEVSVAYRRPFFYEFFGCGYCLSAWVAPPVYVAWYFEPWWALTILAPFALSQAVGIVTRWID